MERSHRIHPQVTVKCYCQRPVWFLEISHVIFRTSNCFRTIFHTDEPSSLVSLECIPKSNWEDVVWEIRRSVITEMNDNIRGPKSTTHCVMVIFHYKMVINSNRNKTHEGIMHQKPKNEPKKTVLRLFLWFRFWSIWSGIGLEPSHLFVSFNELHLLSSKSNIHLKLKSNQKAFLRL